MILPQGALRQSSDPFEAEWLTVDDVVALGRARRKVQVNIATGKWPSREFGTGRNGKPVRKVRLTDLPQDLQLKYAEGRRAATAELEDPNPQPIEAIDDGLTQLTNSLSSYPAEEREAWIAEALRLNDLVNRYEAINPKRVKVSKLEGRRFESCRAASAPVAQLVEHQAPEGCPVELGQPPPALKLEFDFVPAVKALCREAVCTNPIILAALAERSRREPNDRDKPISPHTLERWSTKRKRVGLMAFIRARSNAQSANDGRLAEITPAAIEWLEARWRRYPIATKLYKEWQKAALKNGWKIPKISYLQRRWKNISPVVKTALFKGDKAYTDKFKPFHARSAEDLEALQVLCGDHHVLDVFCWSDNQKAAVRLWLTVWQDVRTGLIWGWHLDYTPSSHTIGCAYATGVRTFGAQPPARDEFQSYIYTDNGKDYRSRNINGEIEVHQRAAAVTGGLELLLTQRGVGLAHDADIKQMLARNYNGREKPVERTFKDLSDTIQSEYFDSGWCGRSTTSKPDAYRDLYTRHQKAMKREGKSPFPLETEVRLRVAEWIEDYNASAHTRATLNGATVVPLQELNRLYTNRFDISEKALALMVMKSTNGPLRKNGLVALGSSYWHDELSKWKGRRGEGNKPLQLEVRYLDSDYRTAWIVLPDGSICEAQRVEVGSYITPNKESLKNFAQRARSERDLIKNATLLQQSIWRGESTEDRIVAEMPVQEEQPMPIAVGEGGNSQARVALISRLDAKRHLAPVTRLVTAAQVSSVEADEGIFSDESPSSVKEFDFDDEQ